MVPAFHNIQCLLYFMPAESQCAHYVCKSELKDSTGIRKRRVCRSLKLRPETCMNSESKAGIEHTCSLGSYKLWVVWVIFVIFCFIYYITNFVTKKKKRLSSVLLIFFYVQSPNLKRSSAIVCQKQDQRSQTLKKIKRLSFYSGKVFNTVQFLYKENHNNCFQVSIRN